MQKIYYLLFFVLLSSKINAQTQISKIFNATYTKVQELKSLSYRVTFNNENPFNPGDVSTGISTAEILFDGKGMVRFKKEETNINAGQTISREIYNNGKMHTFDLVDSIYTEDIVKNGMTSDINKISSMILAQLKEHPTKIKQKKDTLLNGKQCYNFLIRAYDTIANGNHDFTFRTILIEKKTMMPIYFKEVGAGSTFKDGLPIGRLHFFNEKIFSSLKLNSLIADTSFKTIGFYKPNTSMLSVGQTAPPIVVIAATNDQIYDNALKAKVRLVVFGSTTCSANPLSNPMLNRLHTKYSSSTFSIVNIYTGDTNDQVKRYIRNNDLKFPVFMGSRKLTDEFKTMGTPNFYLIDKNGIIVSSMSGYSTSLENELNTKITELLK